MQCSSFFVFFFCFSIGVFFHDHSRFTGLPGKGEGISLTPHYHFHPLHRHLDISLTSSFYYQGIHYREVIFQVILLNPTSLINPRVFFSMLSPYGVVHLVRPQIFQKTNISYPLIRTRTCAYQGVSVSFSEDFA